jgi:hypothetical protein
MPVLGRVGTVSRTNSRWSKQKEATRIREGEAGSRRAEDELTVEDELVVDAHRSTITAAAPAHAPGSVDDDLTYVAPC